jgi:hypothetical protein
VRPTQAFASRALVEIKVAGIEQGMLVGRPAEREAA